jgi:predicted enzyme related to lactoylglutathione lyase
MAQLVGLITTSPNPERLAEFYRLHFGIPYQLNQHGALPPHYECDENGIHFAIIERRLAETAGNITPSFQVDNLQATLAIFERQGIMRLHPIMDLGGGSRVCTIPDPDGNNVRLFESR